MFDLRRIIHRGVVRKIDAQRPVEFKRAASVADGIEG
jgi:hypothetical protein